MRKIVCRSLGAPEGLLLEDSAVPEPAAHEVRIAVHASACNRNELLKLEGRYQQKAALPYTPGSDAAGVISAVGADVSTLRVGDRVMTLLDGSRGAWAEEIVVRADWVMKIPAAMTFAQAAGFCSSYMSAYEALVHTGRTRAGEMVVITGAGGGLGLAAVEIAHALGATVIAVAGSEAKLAIARAAGAHHVIDYKREDMRERVMTITQGRGVDVVIEVVGGKMLLDAQRCIAWRGRVVITGFASFEIPEIRPIILLLKGYDLLGANLYQSATHAPTLLQDYCAQLFAWFEQGRIRPLVSKTFALEEAAAAIRYVERGEHPGKVVVTMRGE